MEQSMIEVFAAVIKKLENGKIPYMVVGSIAAMIYGEPRLTHDMDLVIDILPGDVGKFNTIFPSEEFYCPPKEVLNPEVTERGQFNIIHPNTGIKIDMMVRKSSDHAREEFNRRQKVPLWKGLHAYLATPEDVIIKKLSFFREGGAQKHLKDIRGIMAESVIDEAYLHRWIEKLKLESEWEQV